MIIKDLENCTLEELRELQLKQLEILCDLKEFCKKYEINFFLIGGSCIGALRHQGFIPWDDDIDTMMLRNDYEKFIKLWEKFGDKEKYTLCRTNENFNYHQTTSILRMNNTTFINFHSKNENINHGIYIDINPLDCRENTKFKFFKQLVYSSFFGLFNAQKIPNQSLYLKILSKIFLLMIPFKSLRTKIWKICEKKMKSISIQDCKYLTELYLGPKVASRKLPKEWFLTTKNIMFEGYEMPIPIGAEKWMTMIFGNYMKFPPKEQRKPKHKVVLIDTEKSYKNYKGIYYCIEK